MSKTTLGIIIGGVILFCVNGSANLFAQPIDELSTLKAELNKIHSRIQKIQDVQNEDPFADRVRSVGRKRVAPRPVQEDDSLVIRFYDLSDIFSVAPQYRARMTNDFNAYPGYVFDGTRTSSSGGGFGGGGGGGVFNVPPGNFRQQQAQTMSLSAALVSVDDLIEGIMLSVAPDEWQETGGDATISVLGNTLLIAATDSMHIQIVDLLNLIREHWGKLKTVSVQAYWIRATSSDVQSLLAGDEENRVVGKVDRKQWKSFFEKAQTEKRVAYSAMLCGHNGQTLHAISGQQKTVVMDANPIYTWTSTREDAEVDGEPDDAQLLSKSIAGMRPTRKQFHEGAVIQASPLATRGGNYVILDLHTRVNETVKQEEPDSSKIVVRDSEGNDLSVELNTQPYIAYRMSTTVRCPKDEVMLAGGMTYDSNSIGENPNLYLFVQTRIHTVEEDESDRKIE